jgi:isopenicillin-N N-acyltransferase like protein
MQVQLRPTPGAIQLQGTPHQMGLAHGRAAASAIRQNLASMERAIAALEVARRRYNHRAALAAHRAFVERVAPDALEEISGIAEGAEVAEPAVAALNLPLFQVGSFLPQECSQILVRRQRVRGAGTLLGKTRDASNAIWNQVVLHHHYADHTETIGVHVAGTVTWPGSGVNSAGLALSSSGVWSLRSEFDAGAVADGWLLFNTQLLLRSCRSVDDVADVLTRQPRLTSGIIVAADETSAAAFEATPHRVIRREPQDNALIATNHFESPSLGRASPTPEEYPSTYRRQARLSRAVAEATEPWSVSSLLGLLADHDGYPQDSICRHALEPGRSQTQYASVANLAAGSFDVLLGLPCEALAADSARPEADQHAHVT